LCLWTLLYNDNAMATRNTQSAFPTKWTEAQISVDTSIARAEFRRRRLEEPLTDYEAKFPTAKAAADVIVGALSALVTTPTDREFLAGIISNKEQYSALRSLAAVPISKDDLETLLDSSLNRTVLRQNQELANKLSQLLRSCLDPKRFPWAVAERKATEEELAAAKLATAVVTTVSAVQAGRRGDESKALEGKVKEILITAGYVQAQKRKGGIKQIAHFPELGTFMHQCVFGGHNADFVIRLKDGRVLALECKASNSEVNGFKRLNKEVVVDAGDWHREFGKSSVVASAALRGVFKTANVASAQEQDVFIFWWHSMESLADFLTATLPNASP